MIRDVLVHIPTERPQRPVIDASISLATLLDAHLDAVAIGYMPSGTANISNDDAATASRPYLRWSSRERLSAAQPHSLFLKQRRGTQGLHTNAARFKAGRLTQPPRSVLPPGSMTSQSFCSRMQHMKASTTPRRLNFCFRRVVQSCLCRISFAALSRPGGSAFAGMAAALPPVRSGTQSRFFREPIRWSRFRSTKRKLPRPCLGGKIGPTYGALWTSDNAA